MEWSVFFFEVSWNSLVGFKWKLGRPKLSACNLNVYIPNITVFTHYIVAAAGVAAAGSDQNNSIISTVYISIIGFFRA